MKKSVPVAKQVEAEKPGDRQAPRTYRPPRIEKKRAVSRATLFTGSGPDGGGVIG